MATNCVECETPMRTRKENIRYEAAGLPHVTLRNIAVSRCPNCGNYEVEIPRLAELHRLLARVLIAKRGRLTGSEIRFLRTHLGWSREDFRKHMGATAETVSRWEKDRMAMGAAYDRVLRLLVATQTPVEHYPLEELNRADEDAQPAYRVECRLTRKGWLEAA